MGIILPVFQSTGLQTVVLQPEALAFTQELVTDVNSGLAEDLQTQRLWARARYPGFHSTDTHACSSVTTTGSQLPSLTVRTVHRSVNYRTTMLTLFGYKH